MLLYSSHSIARLPLLLRLYRLEHLVLDRCSGLIKKGEIEEPTTFDTLRWLGKSCAQQNVTQADEVARTWKRMMKERPTGVSAPGPPGSSSTIKSRRLAIKQALAQLSPSTKAPSPLASALPPLVKELLLVPTPSTLLSLCLGLYSLDASVAKLWEDSFQSGFQESKGKTIKKLEDALNRWETLRSSGKLETGERKIVCFRTGWKLVREELEALGMGEATLEAEEFGTDEIFKSFCREKDLVVVSSHSTASQINHSLLT
jgi:hypothetical protein